MALIFCKECKHEVSKRAKTCPGCGAPQGRTYGWGAVVFFVFVGLFIYGYGSGGNSTEKAPAQTHVKQQPAYKGAGECRQFIELHSASHVAREMGTTEEWVVQSHKVNLWKKTSAQGRLPVVGKLRPGSRALLLETSGPDFKVQSPLDGSVGWVNQVQVSAILTQNDKTFEPCN